MNIYIANLDFKIESHDLKELFEEFGTVASANVIRDKVTGKSRGFGFVEMPTDEEGQKAIDELNGSEYEGKNITVSVARPRTERTDRPRFGGGGGGGFNRDRRPGGGGGGGFNRDRRPGGGGGGFNRDRDRGGDRGGFDRNRSNDY